MKSQLRTLPHHFRLQPLRQRVQTAWGVGLTAAALMPFGAAFAQEVAPTVAKDTKQEAQAESGVNSLGTVYVTARKRAELQIDVPISMQTMTAKDLAASGTTSVSDLASQAGFSFTSAQSTGAYGRAAGMVTFRGLQGELGRPSDASGGVFIDGIAITSGISTLGMTDVERVEVLKGPQNAFFGRSTFGGAVNFITKNPADELGGAVHTTLTNKGSVATDASIEGPLVENVLKGRLLLGSSRKAATAHATDGGELGAESSKQIGGTLYFTPTDKLWARVRGNYQKNDDSTPAVAYIPATGNTSCVGQTYSGTGRDGQAVTYTPGTAYFCGSIPEYGSLTNPINANTTIPSAVYNAFVNNSLNDPSLAKSPRLDHTGMASEVKQASFQLGYALPNAMDLAVNVGYNEVNTTAIFDLDKTGTSNFLSAQITPSHDLTMDTRLSTDPQASLRGLVGASLYKSSYVFSQLDYAPGFGGTAATISSNYTNFESNVPAVYGSLEYDLTKQVTATLEGRYQMDKITSYTRAGASLQNESKDFLPRLSLRYKPTTDTSFYTSVAKGVQPLNVNGGYTSATAAGKALLDQLVPGVNDFTPQPKLTSFEIGMKQRVSSNLQFAAAIYDQEWTDRLTGTSVFNPSSCGTTTGTAACPLTASGAGIQTGNDARIRGLELSVDALVARNWTAGAYIDYKKAKWTKYDAASQSVYGSNGTAALTGTAVNFNGNAVARVPELQFSVNSTYRFNLVNGWKSYMRGDVTYVGGSFESDFNFAKTDAYSRIDLRMGFEKGPVSFDLFVKNLANDRSWTTLSRVPNLGLSPLTSFSNQGLTAIAQEARTLGITMGYTF